MMAWWIVPVIATVLSALVVWYLYRDPGKPFEAVAAVLLARLLIPICAACWGGFFLLHLVLKV